MEVTTEDSQKATIEYLVKQIQVLESENTKMKSQIENLNQMIDTLLEEID